MPTTQIATNNNNNDKKNVQRNEQTQNVATERRRFGSLTNLTHMKMFMCVIFVYFFLLSCRFSVPYKNHQ